MWNVAPMTSKCLHPLYTTTFCSPQSQNGALRNSSQVQRVWNEQQIKREMDKNRVGSCLKRVTWSEGGHLLAMKRSVVKSHQQSLHAFIKKPVTKSYYWSPGQDFQSRLFILSIILFRSFLRVFQFKDLDITWESCLSLSN